MAKQRNWYLRIVAVIYCGELSFEEVEKRALRDGLKAEPLSEGRILVSGLLLKMDYLISVKKKVFQMSDSIDSTNDILLSGSEVLRIWYLEEADVPSSWPPMDDLWREDRSAATLGDEYSHEYWCQGHTWSLTMAH